MVNRGAHRQALSFFADLTRMFSHYSALPAGQKYDGTRPLKKETQLALWVSLGTLCRIGGLLQA
ncbi:hypothetical protein B723_17110 [Pseudomonas fluorescens NCIMB 11764]|uniref:Transposase n=1 Tax=Pseudomonas fluorescens NCIMB 11764 TaxID=1221522 RepID=A0A0K1QQJ8_PSEFL|nr:hypothetical protein B723_17110 [Pseudomonas fluorescens NCIMB 11764]